MKTAIHRHIIMKQKTQVKRAVHRHIIIKAAVHRYLINKA
jgi:hypothetical protein